MDRQAVLLPPDREIEIPRPDTVTRGSSFVAHRTAFRISVR